MSLARRVKLDVGGGLQVRGDDYLNVDRYAGPGVRGDMAALPFLSSTADELWSSHTLEHAPMGRVPEVLREWHRVLKPGGRLILQVPNFDYVARYWLTGPDRAWAEQMVFGLQYHEGEFHKCAFGTMTVRGDLEAAGFEVQRIEMRLTHGQETIQAVAVRKS